MCGLQSTPRRSTVVLTRRVLIAPHARNFCGPTLPVHSPLQRRHPVHRLHHGPQSPRLGTQLREGVEVHKDKAAHKAGLSRRERNPERSPQKRGPDKKDEQKEQTPPMLEVSRQRDAEPQLRKTAARIACAVAVLTCRRLFRSRRCFSSQRLRQRLRC